MNKMENKTLRTFVALIDEFGLDDFGSSGGTFEVQSLKKGEIYTEADPRYIDGHESGVVIDDNSCWYHYGTTSFKKRFKEVTISEVRDEKIIQILS